MEHVSSTKPEAKTKANTTSANLTASQSTSLLNSPAVQRMRELGTRGEPPSLLQSQLANLQSTIGNQAVNRLVTSSRSPDVQRAVMPQDTEASGPEGGVVTNNIEQRIQQSQSGGSAMPQRVRNILQPKLQADLKNVRVHTDSHAVQLSCDLNAKAFTYKNHIFYGKGQSPNDLKLTAHEAVHTIQQGAVARRTHDTSNIGAHHDIKGNTAKEGTSQVRPVIQRLTTAEQLEGSAGGAKNDWKIGKFTLRKMSTKYKAILNELRRYEGILNDRVGGDIHGYTTGGAWDLRADAQLSTIEEVIDSYLAAHQEDTRSAAILKVKQEIPKERVIIQYIGAHIDDYANETGRDAIQRANKDRVVEIAMDNARKNMSGFSDNKSGTDLTRIVRGDDEEANQSIESQLGTARTAWGQKEGQVGDAFRGSDTLSVTSAGYAKGNFLSYYMSTVMPAFEQVIREIRGSGIGVMKDSSGIGGVEQISTDDRIYAKIATVYETFAQTLMRALPQTLINAAIAVYARVRKSSSGGNEAFSKKIALATATNTIYVRCFGPALNTMSGIIRSELELGEQQAITAIIQLLAKQGPGVDLSSRRNDEYARLGVEAGVQRAAAEYQRILDAIVLGGEALAGRLLR